MTKYVFNIEGCVTVFAGSLGEAYEDAWQEFTNSPSNYAEIDISHLEELEG